MIIINNSQSAMMALFLLDRLDCIIKIFKMGFSN